MKKKEKYVHAEEVNKGVWERSVGAGTLNPMQSLCLTL